MARQRTDDDLDNLLTRAAKISVVTAAAVQIRPVLHSREGTIRSRMCPAQIGCILRNTGLPAFDDKVGLIWAELMAKGKTAGKPRSRLDMIIAAVAGADQCVVVTDNESEFVGLQVVNPMRGAV